MRSVGILMNHYVSLHQHMPFLQEEVSRQCDVSGNYSQLEEYFNKNQQYSKADLYKSITEYSGLFGTFAYFFKFFGVSVFTLWKAMLLNKKIVFYSPPPIGVVCYRVYCSCFLPRHSMARVNSVDPNAIFYISVADIDGLSAMKMFTACTTENIFEVKKHLYDVYVNNQQIQISNPANKILEVTYADKERYAKLTYLINQLDQKNEEKKLREFFLTLNNRIFEIIAEIHHSDHILTNTLLAQKGLDKTDIPFLEALAHEHKMPITVSVSTCCGGCCS